MIRRFSVALIGLALCLPIFAAPVAAHGPTPFVVDHDALADGTLVGTVVNHTSTRRFNVTVTAVWENGATDISESAVVLVSNLAPHNSSPFLLDPVADVTGKALNSITATGATTGTKPTGGLHVSPGTFTGDVYNGTITNDGAATANNVQVFAARLNAGVYTDAKASAVIATIGTGATLPYVITFSGPSDGADVSTLIAKTGSGVFYTSWNNYFSDLGNATESFVDEIAWMADEGITSGCGAAIFCPKSNVTRAEMAVFLDRAIPLADDNVPPHPFTDIGGLSVAFQQSIQNLYAAGITGGCTATTFCPNQSVTRGQMSKFIVTGYGLAPIPGTPPFTDDNGHFSESYNNRMAADGITSGCGTNLFCPNAVVTREQMAKFLFEVEN